MPCATGTPERCCNTCRTVIAQKAEDILAVSSGGGWTRCRPVTGERVSGDGRAGQAEVTPELLAQRRASFGGLVATVAGCRRCLRMESRTRVLGHANGPLGARVLFLAEAPGRFGADASGVPLSGDRTGRTFEQFLACAGLRRSDIFISNAVLCNPRDAAGRNGKPSRDEVANCGSHLARLLTVLDPAVVVTLGVVALEAIARIEPHRVRLRRDVGQPSAWCGRVLVPLYHPGPRALIHRSRELQECDYRQVAGFLRHHAVQSGRYLPQS